MSSYLINFYNQTGAGPKNISLNFIRNALLSNNKQQKLYIIIPYIEEYKKLESTKNIILIKQKFYNNLMLKILFRIKLDFFLIPSYIKKHQIKSFLSFGNYLVSPSRIYKVVLLHHPYLVDNELLAKLPLKNRIIEYLKRGVFFITTKNVDCIVVQSLYMQDLYTKLWNHNSSTQVKLFPNPISDTFDNVQQNLKSNMIDNRLKDRKMLKILYVSRFYPHKNHAFIIDLSREIKKLKLNIEFYVTLDEKIELVTNFIKIIKDEKLGIINIGELKQEKLKKYYLDSHVFFFPSKSETFGNPLIEAMLYRLPIVVPDVDYAKSVVSNAGIYYNSLSDCVKVFISLQRNQHYYKEQSLKSEKQFRKFPDSKSWYNLYVDLLENR